MADQQEAAFWTNLPGPHSISGIGYTRRRFGFGWSYPEHDRLAAAVHRAATAS
ncbi:hypothetical protein [Nonomuraea fuscirosea]|uniref:hypothetical protein n=1 Tax=Nonomuraea fuscirosea TaxID=1291556 RepID=UPI0034164FE2